MERRSQCQASHITEPGFQSNGGGRGAGTLQIKSATCNLHLSDCTLENKLENSETRGRNTSEGCLRQVEMVAGLGNWQGKEMNAGRI